MRHVTNWRTLVRWGGGFALVAVVVVPAAFIARPLLAKTAAKLEVCPSGCAYSTLQAAIDAASPGATIWVEAGTYTEQISISKTLTVEGHGTAIIRAPGALTPDSDGRRNVIEIQGPVSVSVSGVIVTAPTLSGCSGGVSAGLAVLDGATLTLTQSTVRDIGVPGACFDIAHGIRAGSPNNRRSSVGHLVVDHVLFSGAQLNDIDLLGPGTTGVVTHSTLRGVGPTSALYQVGIAVESDAVATITDNTISDFACDSVDDGCGSDIETALQAFGIADYSSGVVIANNDLARNDAAMYLFGSGLTVQDNRLSDNRYVGLEIDTSSGTVDHNQIMRGGIGVAFAFGSNGPSTQLSFSHNLIQQPQHDGLDIRDGALQDSAITHNEVVNAGGDALHIFTGSTGMSLADNVLRSQSIDAYDETSGSGTAGTANQWDHNVCQTSSPSGLCG